VPRRLQRRGFLPPRAKSPGKAIRVLQYRVAVLQPARVAAVVTCRASHLLLLLLLLLLCGTV